MSLPQISRGSHKNTLQDVTGHGKVAAGSFDCLEREPMNASPDALRQRRHKDRARQRGLRHITVLVPKERASELYDQARRWREAHLKSAAHQLPDLDLGTHVLGNGQQLGDQIVSQSVTPTTNELDHDFHEEPICLHGA